MHKLKQINLQLLVFCHLFMFAYPLVSKTFHEHEAETEEHCCASCDSEPAVDQTATHCPICEYELLNFICEPEFSPSVYRIAYPVAVVLLPETVHTKPTLRLSLRGPPVA